MRRLRPPRFKFLTAVFFASLAVSAGLVASASFPSLPSALASDSLTLPLPRELPKNFGSSEGIPLPPPVRSRFLFGVSTSALQNEGAPAPSDWDRWARTTGKIKDGLRQDLVWPLWQKHADYLQWTQDLGANAFRMSIAWERVQPEMSTWNEEAVDHYAEILKNFWAAGIEPVLTLNHYGLPLWLADRGGFRWSGFPAYYEEFVEGLLTRFRARGVKLKYVLTFNEPEVNSLAGYYSALFPPGRHGKLGEMREAMARVAEAHIRGYKVIHRIYPESQVSFSKNWVGFASSKEGPLDSEVARTANRAYNLDFIDLLSGKGAPPGRLMVGRGEFPKGKWLDFIAINYYFRYLMHADFRPWFFHYGPGKGKRADNGWEIHPDGLIKAVRDSYERWRLPVLITENGVSAVDDSTRSSFLDAHLDRLADVIEQGVPVLGYLHWTLVDNFELAEGYTQKFGLMAPSWPGGPPRPKPSYFRYSAWIRCWQQVGPKDAMECVRNSPGFSWGF